MLRICVWTWLLCQISLTPVEAHSGRKDSQGGHHQRATGTYHFHDGRLVGQTFASKAAGSAALAGGHIGSPEAQSSMASTMPVGDLAMYLPAIDEGDQIVVHTGFTLSYSEPHEQAEWVAYLVTSERLSGGVKRTNNFRVDPTVTTGSAVLGDYKGSGYDRGHLAYHLGQVLEADAKIADGADALKETGS